MTKIYLAGPDVFLPDAVELGRAKVELCAAYGLTGLFPLDNKVNVESRGASRKIFRGNRNDGRGESHHR
jgi:nucleoside 2-deoxyribosyltransferase